MATATPTRPEAEITAADTEPVAAAPGDPRLQTLDDLVRELAPDAGP